MRAPDVERDHPAGLGGVQRLYRFHNGYGASVIRSGFSYGGTRGLWELAVIKYLANDSWSINYDTPITDNVLGHLSDEEVDEVLTKIEALPNPTSNEE